MDARRAQKSQTTQAAALERTQRGYTHVRRNFFGRFYGRLVKYWAGRSIYTGFHPRGPRPVRRRNNRLGKIMTFAGMVITVFSLSLLMVDLIWQVVT
jgi:hypothetical protein